MASTVWKGQLTFGLVSFPVRLQKAARKERIALKYVRRSGAEPPDNAEPADEGDHTPLFARESRGFEPSEIIPVRQGYYAEGQDEPSPSADLQRGFEVAPDQFVVVRPEELRSLRKATSPDMQILRSVRMEEIDPVFLETSYYVIPGPHGEKSYSLFYRALSETQLAALAQVAMHGREHVIVLRAGDKGLIAHTIFYVNEVRAADEYATNTTAVVAKELDLAKKYVEALLEPFRPEEFTDSYREELQTLIESKEPSQPVGAPQKAPGKVVDIMDALRKSLEKAKAQKKPAVSQTEKKPRKRKVAG
jgi:DNA end-binding protein Ku